MLKSYLKLIRVHHYIKNLLVFAAVACSGQIFQKDKFVPSLLGFFAFCMVSSFIYIINDIRDRDRDRLHPVKSGRPIASGAISVKSALILSVGMLAATAAFNFAAFRLQSTLMLGLYIAINIAYSFGLKNIPIVDITLLTAGFLIRIMYGAAISGITVSNWLYLTVISVAFYCALGKRRNELRRSEGGETRKVLKNYSSDFLDKNMYMCLALANVFYALWSMDKDTALLYDSNYLVFTVPIVLLITMKYSMNVEGNSDGDPVEILLHDKVLLALCVIYLAAMFIILYL